MKTVFLVALTATAAIAQPVRLKLPRQINVPNYNHYAPSLSTDGLTMLYASDYYTSDGNKVEMKIAQSKGVDNWGSGEDVTIVNKSAALNQSGGHCLSGDGNTIYFSSKKTGGVGSYDLWMTEKKGGKWSPPQNLGKPLNSTGSEGFPSLSADGKSLYFVRCQTMTNYDCQSCQLYVAESKGQGIWKEPTEVSANFSGYDICYPRILKDGKTLLFSSKKAGGKGGYDLYMSKKTGTTWSNPANMAFLNTAADEQYADVPAQGDAVLYNSPQDGYLTLYRAKLSDEFQPSRILLWTGIARTGTKPTSGFVQIAENETGAPYSIQRIDTDGKFSAVLPVGKSYDVAVTAGNDWLHWSSSLDATHLSKSKKEETEAILLAPLKDQLIHANKPLFDTTNYRILPGTGLELKRLSKLLASHADWKLEIWLFANGFTETAPADPAATFEQMKEGFISEAQKISIPAEKITFYNGTNTPQEEDSYCGWGFKIK